MRSRVSSATGSGFEAAAAVLKLRVPELRDELRSHGLPVGGNKPELRARLMPVATADAVEAFDAQRQVCRKERQNLLIHRQALGFKTGNHGAVEGAIPPPRSSPSATSSKMPRRTTSRR